MRIGTRSLLYGAHALWLHPIVVGIAFWRLYGFPWDLRLWASFVLHDIGYWSTADMDGRTGQSHVELGGRIMSALFGGAWGEFVLRHSRYWVRRHGGELSRLAAADKLAFAMTPWWIYLPMARATGELAEYMAVSQDRQAGDRSFTEAERRALASGNARAWLGALQSYTMRWVQVHKDGCLAPADFARGSDICRAGADLSSTFR